MRDLKAMLDQAKKDIRTMQEADIDLPPEGKAQLLGLIYGQEMKREEDDENG